MFKKSSRSALLHLPPPAAPNPNPYRSPPRSSPPTPSLSCSPPPPSPPLSSLPPRRRLPSSPSPLRLPPSLLSTAVPPALRRRRPLPRDPLHHSPQPRRLLSLCTSAAPPLFSLPSPSSWRRPSPPLTLAWHGPAWTSGPARGAAGSGCSRETVAWPATSAPRMREGGAAAGSSAGPARARLHGQQEQRPRHGLAVAARRRPGGERGTGVLEDQQRGQRGACIGSTINKQ
ncbi:hypothetical protein GQ55_7G315100 [Panicum hallii var. hallii]|uniref:Uncharacterized protein n=1 Tax=Panicum hallii var. hallii TaxID=1504633 RepID=A0A2T7D138_9POAL|nr:hypothetical protein GQ55_7G315100 [Panicum hallii var. hallii]